VSEGTLASALGSFAQPTGTHPGYVAARTAITGTSTAPLRAVVVSDLATLIPLNLPTVQAGYAVPTLLQRDDTITSYDPNYVSPYTQNLNLSVTRSLTRNMTLDIRYVGTLARKQNGNLNLNTNTVLHNQELFDAFEAARRGENPKLLDDMLMGIRLAGVSTAYGTTSGRVNGVNSFGGGQLRMSTSTRADLANGDYVGLANTLMANQTTLGGDAASYQTTGLPADTVGVLLRNGCNRMANNVTSVSNLTNTVTIPGVATRCFPENYLVANSQLNGATYNANLGSNNYHSLQVQFSLRPVQGISFTSTYSTAKSLGRPGSGFTDPLNRDFDYGIGGGNGLRSEPKHTLRMNGTFELPLGPNKLFFGNASGWFARVIERWSTSVILNMQSGSFFSVEGAQAMRYDNGKFVATEYWNAPKGEINWTGGGSTNYYGANTFFTSVDPQCHDGSLISRVTDLNGTAALNTFCDIDALGVIVPSTTPGAFPVGTAGNYGVYALVNPRPGEYGTVAGGALELAGSYTVNANLSKTFRLAESKQLTVRMDASNILNHPAPNPMSTFINFGDPFGTINGKGGGARNFQASLRLTF
jgi:hypothetical protein